MENNSESGLRIKQIIAVVLAVVITSSNLQLFMNTQKKMPVAMVKVEEETKLASYERVNPRVTTRASQERTKLNETSTAQEADETKLIEDKQEEEIQEVEVEEPKENYISVKEIKISKDMDLTKRCGVSKEDFQKLMKDLKVDTSGFFERNSGIIYDLCEKYQLNEVFFCGLIAAESGWNISSNHRKKCNYISMMSKGKLIAYASEEKGLEAAAKLLHNKYLTPGGSFYKGKTLASVQKIFCPNSSTWVGLVFGCMKQVVK